jgi:phosphoribosylglycinamide formyltransferase, formyltetrahydrofolate-dependent
LLAKIAVFVSGGGTNLQALIDSAELKSGKVELVISNKADVYALARAEKAGIKTAVVTEDFESMTLSLLKENEIDIIVLAGFLKILSADFISHYEDRIINVHPSLIPSFCGEGMYGLKVHQAALDYGVRLSGATVHFVNAIPDGGRIIMQKAVDVLEGDTPEMLQKRIMEQAEWELLPRAAEKISSEILSKEN